MKNTAPVAQFPSCLINKDIFNSKRNLKSTWFVVWIKLAESIFARTEVYSTSVSRMSASFSLPKTYSTQSRSKPNLTNIPISGSNESLARSINSLSVTNPRLKTVRRSSTVGTANTFIRWLHFYSVIYVWIFFINCLISSLICFVFSNATIKSKFESNQDEVHPSSHENEDIQ